MLCCVSRRPDGDAIALLQASQDEVKMQSANSALSMTAQQLAASRAVIAARVQPFVTDFVNNIEL